MTQPTDQSSREQEREVPRPAKAKGWSALDLHAAQCYEDAQRFAPRLPDPPTVSAPTAGQLQLSALWELQARVGDAHENHGRNDERTMKAREVFYEALRSALSTPPPTAITAEEAGREGEAKDAWISVHDRVPAVGQEVLVFGQSPWEKAPSIKIDLWDEIHEAPVSFSSATVCVGEGWTENESDDITHWRELPPAPAQSGGQGNG